MSCADKSWRGLPDSEWLEWNSSVPVPVVVGIGGSGTAGGKSCVPSDGDGSGASGGNGSGTADSKACGTRGSGAVDAEDDRPFGDVDVYVYAFRQDAGSFAPTAASRASAESSAATSAASSTASASSSSAAGDCLIDASIDDSAERGGRKARYDGSDPYLVWTESDAELTYPTGKVIYDFYAYYIDDLVIPSSSVTRSADEICFPLTIDGSTDIMSGAAALDESALDASQFSADERGLIKKYAFSAYTARRNVNPMLEFTHHLTRLRFEMYPAADHKVTINSISVKSANSAVFTVVARDRDRIGLKFSGAKTPLALAEADGTPLKQDSYSIDGGWDPDMPLYKRDKVLVGGTLLVAPDSRYEVAIEMTEEIVNSGSVRKYVTKADVDITLPDPATGSSGGSTADSATDSEAGSEGGSASGSDGNRRFAGRQYVIRLAMYGKMDVRPYVSIESWGDGGEIKIDTDEDVDWEIENGG